MAMIDAAMMGAVSAVGAEIQAVDAPFGRALLDRRGIPAAVLHASTLKPFDVASVRTLATRVPAIVSIEIGTIVGGLGSAVAEALAGAGSGTRLTILGIQDHFPVAGSLDFLLEKYGLTPAAIAETVAATLASAERVASATDMDCTGGLG